MTKEDRINRKNQTIIIRRNHIALKEAKIAVNVNQYQEDTFNAKLALCKTQASVIHLCVENKKSFSIIADLLVKSALCKTNDDAIKRIKRHMNNDKASRIVSRSMIINS